MYMWNLEKWQRYLSCKAAIEADVENKCVDNKGVIKWDELGDWDGHIYTLLILCIKQVTSKNLLYSTGTLLNALW